LRLLPQLCAYSKRLQLQTEESELGLRTLDRPVSGSRLKVRLIPRLMPWTPQPSD